MSKVEYMPVDCLQVPKMLFQVEKFKNLSNTAKILYSLFLDRLKFAVQNGWVDHNGDLFVIYPKSEMKKDLNTTRYGVDQAVQELVKIGKLVRIVQNDGKANHFYINDIYENEMEEESMMTLDRIMANMPMEEREIIMDKMVAASRDILGTIADMGYLDEYETPLTPMEERGYYDEEGNLDIDAVEADGYEFGMDLAFGVLSVCEGKPERVLEIQKYVNEQYECCSNKKFMKVLETIARMNGNEEVYIEDMYACNKEARNYYLSELMMCYNISMIATAPTQALTSASMDWGIYYTFAAQSVVDGTEIPADWCRGFADGADKLTELNENAVAAGTAEKVKEVEDSIASGDLKVFATDTWTVNGKKAEDDAELMDKYKDYIYDGYFHESEKASAPSFDIIIDGIESQA